MSTKEKECVGAREREGETEKVESKFESFSQLPNPPKLD